jgi:N-acetylglucosaminylphosphatidylinositol deacetylase
MRALVVISHPDDEAMFFTPIIDYLTSHGHVVEVLCLSNGNDQGLGDVRTLELHAALNKTYGHNSVVNVTVVHHGDMQDGMGTKWPVDLVKKAIDVHAREKWWRQEVDAVDVVVSFDKYGVSGHINHVSTFQGLQAACDGWTTLKKQANLSDSVLPMECWYLDSVPVVRKYSGPVDIVTTAVLAAFTGSSSTIAVPFTGLATAWTSMMQHTSQLTWYRYFSLVASRYSYINSLHAVKV